MPRTEQNLRTGFILSVLILLAISVVSYISIQSLFKSSRLVDQSNHVIATLERAASIMKDAETGQRGYLLTGDDSFLQPYKGAHDRAVLAVRNFRELTADDLQQQANGRAINDILTQRLTILQKLIDQKRSGKAVEPADLQSGKAAMDALRAAINRAGRYEQQLLATRLKGLRRYSVATPLFLVLATLVAIGVAAWAYRRVSTGLKERARLYAELRLKEQETAEANEELAALNEELTASNEELLAAQTQVKDLNEELAASNEELSAANEELTAANEELMAAKEDLANVNIRLEEEVAVRTADLRERENDLATLNEELTASNEELMATNEELHQNRENLQQLVDDLETSEHLCRGIVNSAPFPIGVYKGREMRIVMANPTIMDVWGKGTDIVGKTYHEVLPELEAQDIYPKLDEVFMTGQPFHARHQRVDLVVNDRLQPFYFNYSFTPLFDQQGKVYGVMNTAAEVTDLVLAKEQVERSERNLKEMIEQAPVAMCILTGPEHVIEVANKLIIELWGKPEADVMHKPVFEALPDACGQGLEEVMRKVYETGETFYASEMPVELIRHGHLDVVYQNFVYQAYRDAAGEIRGVIAITIDVTEQVLARKKIEESEAELRRIKQRLEEELEISKQLQQQKDDFIGMASHELKTPLTSLSALIQVAQAKLRNSGDPFLAQAMDKSTVQIKRMTSMINGFLNISRLESGKILIEKKEFDIDALIRETIEEMKLTVTSHRLDYTGCGQVEVQADHDRISSVVSNLISNAVKYSPKGKLVEVRCQKTEDSVTVSVRDEGLGIRQEDLAKIFDRYYRVKNHDTHQIAGFGIGLYLSAGIIERHDGRIWVESEIGEGSTFYFSLPLGG